MKINQRLFDHYGIDTTKDLKIQQICPRPFDTVLIDKNGSCYACECQSWLPQSIGNLRVHSLSRIINSDAHGELKSSINDGTYRYCNDKQCSYLKKGAYLRGGFDWQSQGTLHLRLAIDDSCNLRCPSCRKGMIFHKEGSILKQRLAMADNINDWLRTVDGPIQVHIGSDGDPFASLVYRHFMENTPVKQNIKYSILTNALLFDEFHPRVRHVIDNLKELGVSIDGATKTTYEKLRLGGRWQKIVNNLELIARMKDEIGFRFTLQFVVQKNNYREMSDIIELGKKYKADRVWLNKIEDWNVMGDWRDQNIFRSDHPEHKQFQAELDKIKPHIDQGDSIVPKVDAPQLYTQRKKGLDQYQD